VTERVKAGRPAEAQVAVRPIVTRDSARVLNPEPRTLNGTYPQIPQIHADQGTG